MRQDLDNTFDIIIKNEEKLYKNLYFEGNVEKNPTFFKDMKKMYLKEWEGIRNPNNIFIPFILVSIESILKKIIEIDNTKNVYPKNILEKLLSNDSPLKNINPKIVYQIGEQTSKNSMSILAEADAEDLINIAKDYVSQEWGIPKERLIVSRFDKNAYIINLRKILEDVQERYYSKENKFGNSYRNIIMHSERPLLIEDEKIFAEMINDYCRLIESFWSNVTKYENTQEK